MLPDTRLCVKCSQAVGGEFELSYLPKNLAKAGSLKKKNYGSITVKKTRKAERPKEDLIEHQNGD